jgi:hypothetical protein
VRKIPSSTKRSYKAPMFYKKLTFPFCSDHFFGWGVQKQLLVNKLIIHLIQFSQQIVLARHTESSIPHQKVYRAHLIKQTPT